MNPVPMMNQIIGGSIRTTMKVTAFILGIIWRVFSITLGFLILSVVATVTFRREAAESGVNLPFFESLNQGIVAAFRHQAEVVKSTKISWPSSRK